MVEALNLHELHSKLNTKYDYDEQRVVGIMLARYGVGITDKIVEQCYLYWHLNSRKYLDVFWAGYGKYLSHEEECATKKILRFEGNDSRVYFDMEAFIDIKDQFNDCYKAPYEDRLQLILVNYREGRLHFDESIKIDLEENLDANFAKIREIMEFVIRECRSEHEVFPIAKKLVTNKLINAIKGVTISDVVSTVLGIAGLIPR